MFDFFKYGLSAIKFPLIFQVLSRAPFPSLPELQSSFLHLFFLRPFFVFLLRRPPLFSPQIADALLAIAI